ncbi:hypothetical protein BD413DRAFT_570085 [Trametes elegans]|nr:hypothetical protein BD413DRAFT_570085 [Trametes elegans]
MGERDREHIEILKVISMGTCAFYNDNHTVPLVEFVHYNNLTFCSFRRLASGLRNHIAIGRRTPLLLPLPAFALADSTREC